VDEKNANVTVGLKIVPRCYSVLAQVVMWVVVILLAQLELVGLALIWALWRWATR
jgi:hypothetical protein